jgi:Carboxypeptidase regulatory-like domain
MSLRAILLTTALLLSATACHHGRLMNGGQKQTVGGTIAGIVTASDRGVPLAGRKVTAIDVASGARYDATTGINGGYTIQVPRGKYRLAVELRDGETVSKQPAETTITNSDLDAQRDFVVTAKAPQPSRVTP